MNQLNDGSIGDEILKDRLLPITEFEQICIMESPKQRCLLIGIMDKNWQPRASTFVNWETAKAIQKKLNSFIANCEGKS